MVFSVADVAQLFNVTNRTVRGWIERGWLPAVRIHPKLYAATEWDLATFVLKRLEAYRAWVRGDVLGVRAPQKVWIARRGAWEIEATVHAKITGAEAGLRPWKAETWYVLTWRVDNWRAQGRVKQAVPEGETVRTKSPQKARRWLAEHFARLGSLELAGRARKSQAWWPEEHET